MMGKNRFRGLRILVMVILALLIVQFEFGMAVTLANPPQLSPFGFSILKISDALNQAGVVAVIHASLGTLLAGFSVVGLLLSLRSRVISVQIVGSLAFLTTVLAASLGVAFTQSGFQNDNYSHGMATNFILSYTFYFLELYFLKPAPKPDRSNFRSGDRPQDPLL